MKITVCIGSSCHIKGSHRVVEALKNLIAENAVEEKVSLAGTFCMGNCQKGISTSLDGVVYSVTPETAEAFFEKEVLSRIGK